VSLAIAAVRAREILDSRGRPTVEADVTLADGSLGRASVPSGASTGRHEKHERRDGGSRHGGLGVRDAVAAVNGPVCELLVGRTAEPVRVDAALVALDGTDDRSGLGANAILAVSLALVRACALARGIPVYRQLAGDLAPALPLPLPMVNLISGGRHARYAMDVQDILVIPVGAGTYAEALEWACDVHRAVGTILDARGMLPSGLADEGGYGLALPTDDALALAVAAIEQAGRVPGVDVAIAIDVAATQLYDAGRGVYAVDGATTDAAGMIERAADWAGRYPVISIEDLLHEDDWNGWCLATEALGHLQLVGDDLFTTNVARVRRGVQLGVANAVLVKPNQIGTLSETCDVVDAARGSGYRTVMSARSGETEDPILADLAVGLRAGQIKIGSVARSERLAKYNRLLQIEEELGDEARLATPFGAHSRRHGGRS
jgi:enolase